jgi:AcrR family transcriptional regulator
VTAKSQTWGGRTAAERQAERRARLLDAAVEMWDEGGWSAVTMRGVCARSGLIDRYFYENFADRDELLATLWDQVRDDITTGLTAALTNPHGHPLTLLREAVTGVVVGVALDPRKAQILFGEHAGSAVLERRRRELLLTVTDVIVAGATTYLRPGIDLSDLHRSSLIAVGGVLELLTAWRFGDIEGEPSEIIENIVHFGTILGAYYLPESVATNS